MPDAPVTNRPRRSRCVAALAGVAVAHLAAATVAPAQLADARAIRHAASELSARSRLLAHRAGPGYAEAALEAIRTSCRNRAVTRFDDRTPADVHTDAAADADSPLLTLALDLEQPASAQPAPVSSESGAGPAAAAGKAGLQKVDDQTDAASTARGLELRQGQVRTAAALGLPRDGIGTIELDIASASPSTLLLGWSDSVTAPRLRRNNARIELLGDGLLHTYAVDAARALARGLGSGDSVQRLFLATRGGTGVRVEGLRVWPRTHRYAGRVFGAEHEVRGGELRRVLFMHPSTTHAIDVDIPADSPVFEAGLGILDSDGVIEFEVAIDDNGNRSVLRKRLVRNGPWEDIAVDLAAFSGRRVRLTLGARGSRPAVALWSSPLVRPRFPDDRTEPFVVLLEDALRADRLSLYGGPVATPAHERLASTGVTFERAFAQATQTRPSVASMMTSLMPSSTGTWDFSDTLSDGFVTLAEALRACGFATAAFLQNGNAGPYAGLAQGFDAVFDEETSGPRTGDLVGRDSAFERWTAAQRGRPYFAYVHALDPHGPYDPANRPDVAADLAGDALLRDRSIDAPWVERPTAAARRRLYDAEVAANDQALGQLLDRLDARGDLARSVFAVVADHGEFLGEHGGLWRHHPPAHVEVARVPFVLRAPGSTPSRAAAPVALLDLMPTLLDLAHVDFSGLAVHGTSLAPALQGHPLPDRAVPSDEMAIVDGRRPARGCGSFATSSALWLLSCTRDSDYSPDRLLRRPGSGRAPLRRFLLDAGDLGRESDPGPWAALLMEGIASSALREYQQAGIDAWRRVSGGPPGSIVSEPGTAERLRSLGYTE